MRRMHLNRTFRLYITVLLVILVHSFIVLPCDLSAEDHASRFVFHSQSDYWPTGGWKTSTPEKQGMSSEVLSDLFREIEDINKDTVEIYSMLIVRNGYVVAEANIADVDAFYQMYSTTKSFTSAMFGIALGKGHIRSIDQRVLDFFPELSRKNNDPRKASIILKHLLTMSCGLEWPEFETSYSNPENPLMQMFRSENWAEYALSRPVAQQPGLAFNYNSGCSHLLLAVLHQTRLNVTDFAQKNLFTPLGISADRYAWYQDRNGIPDGCSSLRMCPRDMAKFGYLYLKGGCWDGGRILPETWVEESAREHMKIPSWPFKNIHTYGYQWYIQPFGFHSLGYHGQYIFVVPDHELVVVFTSNLPRRETSIPIDLLKTYIIPAVKDSKPLPENEKALAALRSKIKCFNGH